MDRRRPENKSGNVFKVGCRSILNLTYKWNFSVATAFIKVKEKKK